MFINPPQHLCSSFIHGCANAQNKCMNIDYCYTKTLKYVKAVISDNIGKNLEKLGLIRGLQWNQIYENITHTKMLFISIRLSIWVWHFIGRFNYQYTERYKIRN